MTFPATRAASTTTLECNKKKIRILKTSSSERSGEDTERLVFDNEPDKQGPTYCRLGSNARNTLEQDLLQLYNKSASNDDKATTAAVFPSGMAAIMTVLTALLRRKSSDNNNRQIIVYGSELYFETPQVIQYLQEEGRVDDSIAVDVTDPQALFQLFQSELASQIRVFYWESASNPRGLMLDPAVLTQLKQLAPTNCIFVCDNTWLSAVAMNPFARGTADICIESMTKYLSGGSCIGGMAVARNATVMQPVLDHLRFLGLYMDADRCRAFSQELAHVDSRVQRTSKTALMVAEWLEQQQQHEQGVVLQVDYPLLTSHVSHAVASECLKLGPGCMWLQLAVSQEKLFQVVCAANSPIEFKTSFGGPYSRIDSFPHPNDSSSRSSDENDHDSDNNIKQPTVWLRLSMGFREDTNETIDKVKTLLDRLNTLQ